MTHVPTAPDESRLPPPAHAAKARVRATARHLGLDGLWASWSARGRIESALARPRISLPYLHAIPERREAAFRELLLRLAPTHTFISYSEAVARLLSGEIDKPYVAFSFDDGFVSNVRAARILEEFGATGCFFVPPNFIGTPDVAAAQEFYGFKEGVFEPAMTWADLESLKSRGHEIENHTLNHRVMSWISKEQMTDEIGLGAQVLRERLGQVRHFAWPRGRFSHFTEAAAQTVFATGHESCASAERGAHTQRVEGRPESLCLRRDHIMAEWPVRHSLYFLARSASLASSASNRWPDGWGVAT
jgi:peptidoglycan/xylan/chitin deacetylase (PgdA/CDA1 family)